MDSFRKAYGALKDSTIVGLAKVNNGKFKDLDIAIFKATDHVESPPKECHVQKIISAVTESCPQSDVTYCIYALSRRLAKTRSWIVAVKTLVVFHRLLREGDLIFKEQLVQCSTSGNVLGKAGFKDDSTALAWDCSAWVRAYVLFLEERIECFRVLRFDIEADTAAKSAHGASTVQGKINVLNPKQLLEHIPSLQQLLYRLVCCQPEGLANCNFLIRYAFTLVVKESFKVYCAINDGIISLVDVYFEMPKLEAVKALGIYKKAGRQTDELADFFSFCKTLDLAHTFRFPILKQTPPSFHATMEEYVKEAPSALQKKTSKKEELQKPEDPEKEVEAVEPEKVNVNSQEEQVDASKEEPAAKVKVEDPKPIPAEEPVDLLDLTEISPESKQIGESNALALAIIRPGNDPLSTNNAFTDTGKVSGWELVPVTQQGSMNKPRVDEMKMRDGFNELFLDSLYKDEDSRRQLDMQRAGYSTNYAYEMTPQNPFTIVPQMNTQMTMMPYQQQFLMPQRNTMVTVPYNPYTAVQNHPQQQQNWSTNPFRDPFGYCAPNGNHTQL